MIFDVFETLIQDTAEQWEETFQRIIDEQRLNVSAAVLRQTWLDAGEGFRSQRASAGTPYCSYFDAWQRCFQGAFNQLSVSGDPGAAIRRVFDDLAGRHPYPEVVPALGQIQGRWRTAVLSNADDAFLSPVLNRLGVKFEAVVSSEGVGTYKPQARLFQEMLDRLAVAPAQAVYVGDRQFEDVQGAAQVGLRTVWINRAGAPINPQLPAPDFQITSLLELPGLISRRF